MLKDVSAAGVIQAPTVFIGDDAVTELADWRDAVSALRAAMVSGCAACARSRRLASIWAVN